MDPAEKKKKEAGPTMALPLEMRDPGKKLPVVAVLVLIGILSGIDSLGARVMFFLESHRRRTSPTIALCPDQGGGLP